MRTPLRLSLALLCGSLGCVGGPVSDWPGRSHDSPTGGRPAGSDDEEGVSKPSTRPVGETNGSNAGRMDAGVAAPPAIDARDAADAGAPDAGEACIAADARTCADPCTAAWQRVWEGEDDFATGDFARLGCDARLSDP